MPEWAELINESKLYHNYFTVKEARLAFIWSRMIRVDDSSNSRKHERSRCDMMFIWIYHV